MTTSGVLRLCETKNFWCVCHRLYTPPAIPFFFNNWLSVERFQKKRKKKRMMSAVLRFLPFNVRAHKSSACNAWTAAALRLIRRMLPSRITLAAIVLFIPRCQCLTSDGNVHFNYLSFFYTWDIVCMCDMCLRCLFQLSLSQWCKSCFLLYFNANYFGNYCYMLFLHYKKPLPVFQRQRGRV